VLNQADMTYMAEDTRRTTTCDGEDLVGVAV
jgi:hypothetical protein